MNDASPETRNWEICPFRRTKVKEKGKGNIANIAICTTCNETNVADARRFKSFHR